MNELAKTKGKGAFSVGNWQEIRKAGGESPTPAQITTYLHGRTDRRLSREELIQRIAISIGVSSATLSRYLAGRHDGMEYSGLDPARQGVVSPNDFDIVRAAATVIESFYESRLGVNMNNAGCIFWLKNRDNTNWHDSMDMTLSANANQEREQLSREEIAARYQALEEFREKPQLPDGLD